MNKVKEAQRYLAQIVAAIAGLIAAVLILVIPELAELEEVLIQVLTVIIGAMIVGISLQKHA